MLGLEGAHQMKWLALAGLPRVLAEADADPVCRTICILII